MHKVYLDRQSIDSAGDEGKWLSKKHVNVWCIILFAIGRSVAAQAQLWNEALSYGVMSFVGGVAFAWTGHLCVALCIAEMASALPFTGGTFGFIRGLRGPFTGYLVGITELVINLANSSLNLFGFGLSCTTLLEIHEDFQPIFWLIPIVVFSMCELTNPKLLWNTTLVFCLAGIFIIVLYFVSSANSYHSMEFITHNIRNNHSQLQRTQMFFDALPYQNYMFISVEILPVIARNAIEPSKAVPTALLCNIVYLLITTLLIVFLCSTQYPGVSDLQSVHNAPLPLSYSFSEGFGMTLQVASFFSVILFFTSTITASYILVRITDSMMHSKLLPSFLTVCGVGKRPVAAVVFVIGQQLAFVLFYYLTYRFKYQYFINFNGLGSLGLYTIYFVILLAYIKFVREFEGLRRQFRNPFGIYASYYGIFVFMVASAAAIIRFGAVLIPFQLLWFGSLFVLYKLTVERFQNFNEEEEKVFMQTYIINANRMRIKRIKRNSLSSASLRSAARILAPFRSKSQSDKSGKGSNDSGSEKRYQVYRRRRSLDDASYTSTAVLSAATHKVVPIASYDEDEDEDLVLGGDSPERGICDTSPLTPPKDIVLTTPSAPVLQAEAEE